MKELKSSWSDLQSADEIDVGRYFEYDDDAKKNFKNWLSFLDSDDCKVLEVGSGTGFFTNILLNLFPKIKLTCLEPDASFVQILKNRFSDRIEIIVNTIEDHTIQKDNFDVAISHIVIHNLSDPILAIKQIAKTIKSKGYLVAIEPLPASRHYYSSKEVEQANDFLDKAKIHKCIAWSNKYGLETVGNPWQYCYPQFFEEAKLIDIQSHGWTSVFTLSDNRFDFDDKKKWLEKRMKLLENAREETTMILLQAGEQKKDIDNAYKVLFDYHKKLLKATKAELTHIHEQEINHRIITIGRKP
ncbi:MAG: class I SAM-dependent methyltransferase [Asgard group archaeon]|nr:class I SAM-dependent methyltransferase [Asgard group archaeon]